MEFKIKIDDEQENNNKKLENYSSAEVHIFAKTN